MTSIASAAEKSDIESPRLARPVTVHLRGDWGQANMHRICGWLAQEMGDRAAEGSKFAVWSGRGGQDSIDAVLSGEADIAVLTPTAAARLFANGWGISEGQSAPQLRALAVIPQRDRLVVAVDAELPVHELHDLADPRLAPDLRLATSADDGINLVGYAAHRVLDFAGVDVAALVESGAAVMYDERPFPVVDWLRTGRANVIIHEAIMMPAWQRAGTERNLRYLPVPNTVLDRFDAWGWPAATVPANYLPGLAADLQTLDFSDFVVLTSAELDDDVAYLATWCMVQTRQALEAQYAHIASDRSPVTYPLDPARMADTPIALHPAAERAYADLAGVEQSTKPAIWG